jgi:hypothetical protein
MEAGERNAFRQRGQPGVLLQQPAAGLPTRLRKEPDLDHFTTDNGWFYVIHPDTGEWLQAGWHPGARLSEGESTELDNVWRQAGLDGNPKLWPMVGAPPPRLPDEPAPRRITKTTHLDGIQIGLPKEMPAAIVQMTTRRGYTAIIDPESGLVERAVGVVRLGPTNWFVHPRVPVRVQPDGSVTLIGPGRLSLSFNPRVAYVLRWSSHA